MQTDPIASAAFSPILAPMTALILWSLAVLLWMMATRLPAMRRGGIRLGALTGTKGSDADGVLPTRTQWVAHNHNHLMEQPTLFYAVCAVLALADAGHAFNLQLAWAYVALRIAHSIVQAIWNRVIVRFALFALASAVLIALALNAAAVVFTG